MPKKPLAFLTTFQISCATENVGHILQTDLKCPVARKKAIVALNFQKIFQQIKQIIVKTLIATEPQITQLVNKNPTTRNNCFELYGYDILIDDDLKPWLLEVNLSPSFATDAPLDMSIKSNLLVDTLNLVGIKRFDRKKESMNKIKNRMKGLYGNTQNKLPG